MAAHRLSRAPSGASADSAIPELLNALGDFVGDAVARHRYWARSYLGWRQIALAQPNAGHLAVTELQRVLGAGARAIILNIGPVLGKSPADLSFDRFWGLVNEAAIPVIFHIDFFGYHDFFSSAWGEVAEPSAVRLEALSAS